MRLTSMIMRIDQSQLRIPMVRERVRGTCFGISSAVIQTKMQGGVATGCCDSAWTRDPVQQTVRQFGSLLTRDGACRSCHTGGWTKTKDSPAPIGAYNIRMDVLIWAWRTGRVHASADHHVRRKGQSRGQRTDKVPFRAWTGTTALHHSAECAGNRQASALRK